MDLGWYIDMCVRGMRGASEKAYNDIGMWIK